MIGGSMWFFWDLICWFWSKPFFSLFRHLGIPLLFVNFVLALLNSLDNTVTRTHGYLHSLIKNSCHNCRFHYHDYYQIIFLFSFLSCVVVIVQSPLPHCRFIFLISFIHLFILNYWHEWFNSWVISVSIVAVVSLLSALIRYHLAFDHNSGWWRPWTRVKISIKFSTKTYIILCKNYKFSQDKLPTVKLKLQHNTTHIY